MGRGRFISCSFCFGLYDSDLLFGLSIARICNALTSNSSLLAASIPTRSRSDLGPRPAPACSADWRHIIPTEQLKIRLGGCRLAQVLSKGPNGILQIIPRAR
ncbi:hypothetical protein K469DRAFT_200755 [Zopfia rhizophila CBS 207.26]|uniref:Uncharacterized protein n=1 Tax=Zopfia rhizophila CBS 207.26 TaxID=1314779 RepID=A0A6A6E0K7_9PEZI|nr:hypothetical protein K469DRAFT_200755 [Zopfia rhizophila CBS 207.26]